jgi:hypothetical protein
MEARTAGAGLTPCRPPDAIGPHDVCYRARERQQRPAPVAVGQQDAGQGEQLGRDQHTDEYHATRMPTVEARFHVHDALPLSLRVRKSVRTHARGLSKVFARFPLTEGGWAGVDAPTATRCARNTFVQSKRVGTRQSTSSWWIFQ